MANAISATRTRLHPTNRTVKTIFFDLDGTLIDHFNVIHRCFVLTAGELDLTPPDLPTVRRTVGGSLPVTASRLFGEEIASTAVERFQQHFERIFLDDITVLPGVDWLLPELHDRGLQLAVFTNKTGHFSRSICTHLGFDRWLSAVIGSEDTPWRKPMPEFTQHALDRVGASAAESVMIGDSPFDVAAARAVDMPCYCVATGSHSLDQLRAEPLDGAYSDLPTLAVDVFGLDPTTAGQPA